jgi:hypothetical protein
VHGRILVLFARDNGMSPDGGPLSPENHVHRALQEGLVRRVYHVIPDDAWGEVEETLRRRGVERDAGAFRLEQAGAPVHVLARRDLAALAEPVLVELEADRWSPAALDSIAARLRDGTLESELVVWSGAPERARVLEGLARGSP